MVNLIFDCIIGCGSRGGGYMFVVDAERRRSLVIFIGMLLLSQAAHAQEPETGTRPLSGYIQMPPVTPEEAMRYLSSRVVPRADLAPPPATVERGALVKLNVDPVLAHDLPETKLTPSGFGRADFATANPDDMEDARKRREEAVTSSGVIPNSPPAKAIIADQPPLTGAP